MEFKKVAHLINLNRLNYGYLYKDFSDNEIKALVANWAAQLKDVSDDVGQQAFISAQQNVGGRPVDIGNMWAEIKKLTGSVDGYSLWLEAVKAANKIAGYTDCYSYTFVIEELGITQGELYKQKSQKVFEGLSPAIKEYYRNAGELARLGRKSDDEQDRFVKPVFLREIKDLIDNTPRLANTDRVSIGE